MSFTLGELSSGLLVLEISEGAASANIDSAIRAAGLLREVGVALAIDDFGMGYSSLSYLALLHPRILKLGRTFQNMANEAPKGERLLEAVIAIGNSLDAMVVAEGIETTSQVEMLRRLGYKFGQGNLFSPPVPPDLLVNMLEIVPGSSGGSRS